MSEQAGVMSRMMSQTARGAFALHMGALGSIPSAPIFERMHNTNMRIAQLKTSTCAQRFVFGPCIFEKNYTRPGSNWRPSACAADVVATRPLVPVTIVYEIWAALL
jgi:hypothetical protein